MKISRLGHYLLTALVLSLGLALNPARAVVFEYNLALTLDQSLANHALDPATPVDAGGLAAVTLDTGLGPDNNLLSWDITWENLSGTANAMHFHGPALPGQAAGVLVNIFTNETSGDHSATGFTIGSSTISDAFASELQSGLWYINVHTTLNPAGEIRAQVVPAPASLALLGLGLMALGLRRRS